MTPRPDPDVEGFLALLAARRAPRTVEAYRRDLDGLARWLGRPVGTVTPEALERWLAEPETRYGEFRFPGMLKIFFGADPAGFASDQADHHAGLAERFEAVRDAADRGELTVPPRRRLVLDTGIELHRWWEARWRELADRPLLE